MFEEWWSNRKGREDNRVILEILEMMNEEAADKEDMKKFVEISLNTIVTNKLFTEEQINQ